MQVSQKKIFITKLFFFYKDCDKKCAPIIQNLIRSIFNDMIKNQQ